MIVILTRGPPKSPICFDAQVILATGGILVGATVVSQGAGEIASELGLAISKKMKFLGLKAQDIELYLISHDPRDGGFCGGRHGWGGAMITFLELADMVDATQEVAGGVGWGDDHVP